MRGEEFAVEEVGVGCPVFVLCMVMLFSLTIAFAAKWRARTYILVPDDHIECSVCLCRRHDCVDLNYWYGRKCDLRSI